MKVISLILLFSFSLTSFQPTSAYLLDGQYQAINGNMIPYSNFNETHLLVNVMQTTCSHCFDQHFELQTLYEKNISKIEYLSLSVGSADTLEVIEAFAESYPTPWHFGLDTDGYFAQKFGITATPTLLFFDPEGELLFTLIGKTQADIIENKIKTILNISNSETSDSGVTTLSQSPVESNNEILLNFDILPVLTSIVISIISVRSFRKYYPSKV